MARIALVVAALLLVWLVLGRTGMTWTVPGPEAEPARAADSATPSLAERLDHAGDLVLNGPGQQPAGPRDDTRATGD